MSNHQKYLKVLVLLFPAILMIFFLSTGCETEKVVTETVTVRDTVTVTVEVHDTVTVFVNGVEVDTIMVNPPMIAQGNWVELTASASLTNDQTFTYSWFANAGEFDATEGDTVHWKSPDEPGVYTITVHATDGTFIGMGATNVGVEMYVPTETPYYLGDAACAGCHSGKHTEWAGTAHAHAWETLQNSGHPASYCNPCHAAGWDYDSTQTPPYPIGNTGNSGYDEAPIEKFVNVQCENCHGAASEHVANIDPTLVEVSYDVMNCGKCHDGEHHPFLTEWLQSPHNFSPRTGSCEGCHEGVAAAIRLSGDVSNFYGSGTIAGRPDPAEVPVQPAVCQTCHDPHDATNPGQLRTIADVPLVENYGRNPVITEGGVGKLCAHCHHARRGPEAQIAAGSGHFGPHANPQADMLKAETAYFAVADPTFPWAGPSHLNVQNSCKTCHLSMVEFGGGPGGAAVVGHEFIPKPAACVNCHGPITEFTDILAAADFDGNGVIEGLQIEVHGLLNILRDAIVATGLDTTNGFIDAIGDTSISTAEQRTAGWNWAFVEEDKSFGIHNPDYAVQVLQQTILYIGGTLPTNAPIVRDGKKAVAQW